MAMATSSVEANKQAIRRLYDETNKGNYDFLDELLAPGLHELRRGRLQGPARSGRVQGTDDDVPDLVPGPVVPGRRADRRGRRRPRLGHPVRAPTRATSTGSPATGNKVVVDGLRDLPIPRAAGHRPLAGVRRARPDGADPAAGTGATPAPAAPAPTPARTRRLGWPPDLRRREQGHLPPRHRGALEPGQARRRSTSCSRPTTRARARPACRRDRPARR